MDTKFVAELLIELMQEYNRVSLPCLGSFLGQYSPAQISDNGTKIYPPSKFIDFHQNEIWNDERLEKLIARRLKISLGKAKEQVAFWVDDICLTLSTGKEVELEGFGSLRVVSGSKLEFIQKLSGNLLLESFGLDVVDLPDPTEVKAQSDIAAEAHVFVPTEIEVIDPPVGVIESEQEVNDYVIADDRSSHHGYVMVNSDEIVHENIIDHDHVVNNNNIIDYSQIIDHDHNHQDIHVVQESSDDRNHAQEMYMDEQNQTKALIVTKMHPSDDFLDKLDKKKKIGTFHIILFAVVFMLILGLVALFYFGIMTKPDFGDYAEEPVQKVMPTADNMPVDSLPKDKSQAGEWQTSGNQSQVVPKDTANSVLVELQKHTQANAQAENLPDTVASISGGKGFFRIKLASFASIEEAKKMVQEMNGRGYKSVIIKQQDKQQFGIYIGNYDTHTSGQVVLDFLKGKDSSQIFKNAEVNYVPSSVESY